MTIKAVCTKCEWEGIAEVGRKAGGCYIRDYICPECGSPVKRGKGIYSWVDARMAKLAKLE